MLVSTVFQMFLKFLRKTNKSRHKTKTLFVRHKQRQRGFLVDVAVGQEIGEVREAGKDLQLGTQTRAVSGSVVLFNLFIY